MASQHWALGAGAECSSKSLSPPSVLSGGPGLRWFVSPVQWGRLKKSELSDIFIPVPLSPVLLGYPGEAEPSYKGKKWVMVVRQEGKVIFSYHIPNSLHRSSPH